MSSQTDAQLTPRYEISGTAALRIALIPLAGTIAALILLRVGAGPSDAFATFATRFLGIFLEAVPFLVIGTLVSGLLEVYVSRTMLTRVVPCNPILASLTGALLGFVFPVCECGVVPVTRRLFGKGLPMSAGISFLLASPVMNPIVLASTATAFGFGPVMIGRIVITFLVATVVGLAFAAGPKMDEVLKTGGGLAVVAVASSPPRTDWWRRHWSRVRTALELASDEFFEMGRYLVLGSIFAALLQTVVSQDTLMTLGRGPVLSVLVMQALAYVLSVCSTVDAFLALAFGATFSNGSLLAFLTFGPMVDVKSTLMFAGVFRPRAVLYLIGLPLALTFATGVWINLNLGI